MNKKRKNKPVEHKAVKRGRGRPRKDKSLEVIQPKRKRGRPRKNPLHTESSIPKKRGRPRKYQSTQSKYSKRNEEAIPLVPTKIGKLIGYCPKCHTGLSTLDRVKIVDPEDTRPDIYYCYNCMKEVKKSSLLENNPVKKTETKYKNKREYLEDYLQVSEDSRVPMNPPDVLTHKDLGATPDVPAEP